MFSHTWYTILKERRTLKCLKICNYGKTGSSCNLLLEVFRYRTGPIMLSEPSPSARMKTHTVKVRPRCCQQGHWEAHYVFRAICRVRQK